MVYLKTVQTIVPVSSKVKVEVHLDTENSQQQEPLYHRQRHETTFWSNWYQKPRPRENRWGTNLILSFT